MLAFIQFFLSLILRLLINVRDGDHARIFSRQYARIFVTICANARRQEIKYMDKNDEKNENNEKVGDDSLSVDPPI